MCLSRVPCSSASAPCLEPWSSTDAPPCGSASPGCSCRGGGVFEDGGGGDGGGVDDGGVFGSSSCVLLMVGMLLMVVWGG